MLPFLSILCMLDKLDTKLLDVADACEFLLGPFHWCEIVINQPSWFVVPTIGETMEKFEG